MITKPKRPASASLENITMAYILSLAVVVLGLGIWQDCAGSAHTEGDLGSERHGQRSC